VLKRLKKELVKNEMNLYPLTFTIPTDVRELEFVFWMRPFNVEVQKTRYQLNKPFCTLYMQKVVPYNVKKSMNPTDANALSFQITEANLFDIQEAFLKVDSWFSEESIRELYGTNDNGMLMFNMEYKDLKVTYVDESSSTKKAIQILPAPVEIGKDLMEPGAILFINRQENAIVLRTHQYKRLSKFIRDFNFQAYMQFAMICFQYSLSNGNILGRDEIRRITTDQILTNSNFKIY